MMSDAAAHHELRSEPRLPLEQLRDLRIEALKKKLGLQVTSERDEKRGRVYRIAE